MSIAKLTINAMVQPTITKELIIMTTATILNATNSELQPDIDSELQADIDSELQSAIEAELQLEFKRYMSQKRKHTLVIKLTST